ncbi:MAG TPA: N-acetylmuramoyl-L-alanine amidase [Thermoanaerobaculia bacterium]|jgi:N-acetylmuramoyl-L-alanine amidase
MLLSRECRRIVVVALVAASMAAAGAGAATLRAALDDGLVASLTDEVEIFVEGEPLPGEGLLAFSRRLTGGNEAAAAIAAANGGSRHLKAGVRYRVPYELLSPELKLRAIRALFPRDGPRAEGWSHQVPAGGPAHSLWRLAVWFTGGGRAFGAIREANALADDEVPAGASVLVPAELLLPIFRAAQMPLSPAAAPPGAEYAYERDAQGGEYLVYRLKKGEALYSSVVMRFNGSTFAEDVNGLAREIAAASGIRDVTDMPVGQPVKVPFDLLLPEYLPPRHPRRVEYETNRTESAKYSNTVRTSTLEGITVILDAGHGGQDPGAIPGDVWESTYVYDVMLRVKKILETRTAARVMPTTRDGSNGFEVLDRDKLPRSYGHAVLTDPPYAIADTTAGTHLRWYLANSLHKSAVRRGGDPLKTIFLSIHADSLHYSVRGAMTYVPAASLTRGDYGKVGQVYQARREVREGPRVSFSWKERVRSEGLSRQLAGELIAAFRRHGLAVHPDQPIRDRVIRCRRCQPWVPAVVRRNAVPAKLLLEICNLNNREDRRLLQTRTFRQQVAEAIVDGILAYYGESAAPPRLAGS